jgi:hypothetical protein
VLVDRPKRGCSSMVEQQPSKLNTRVRFPSPAPNNFNGLARVLRSHSDNQPEYRSNFCQRFSVARISMSP